MGTETNTRLPDFAKADHASLPASGSAWAIRYSSFAQAPRSEDLQRAEQKGRLGFSAVQATGLWQVGQWTIRGAEDEEGVLLLMMK
jgi:hypothetical protein